MSAEMYKTIKTILENHNMTFDDLKQKELLKVHNDPWMSFNIEYIGDKYNQDTYALAHYGKQNGDMMADPDMEFIIVKESFVPCTFQNDYIPIFQQSIELDDNLRLVMRRRLLRQLIDFSNTWAKNLKDQGFTELKAQ